MIKSRRARKVMTALLAVSILGFCLGFGLLTTGCAPRPKIEVRTVYVPVKAKVPDGVKEPCVIPMPPPNDAKDFDFLAWIGQALVEILDCDGKRAASVVINEGEVK